MLIAVISEVYGPACILGTGGFEQDWTGLTRALLCARIPPSVYIRTPPRQVAAKHAGNYDQPF